METPVKQNPIGLPVNNGVGLGAPGEMPVPATPNKQKPVNQTGLTPQKMLLGLLGGKRRKTNARKRKARSLKRRNNKSTRRR